MSTAQKIVVGKINEKYCLGWEESRSAGLTWIQMYGVNWIHLAPESNKWTSVNRVANMTFPQNSNISSNIQ
jgi:hypothetical protein